jgi:hypothetical protein
MVIVGVLMQAAVNVWLCTSNWREMLKMGAARQAEAAARKEIAN